MLDVLLYLLERILVGALFTLVSTAQPLAFQDYMYMYTAANDCGLFCQVFCALALFYDLVLGSFRSPQRSGRLLLQLSGSLFVDCV